MGQATEHRKLVPVIRDLFQVTGRFIVATFPFGEKQFRNEAQILIDGNHAMWRGFAWRSSKRFKHGQTKTYTGGTKEISTICFHDHFLTKSGLSTIAYIILRTP